MMNNFRFEEDKNAENCFNKIALKQFIRSFVYVFVCVVNMIFFIELWLISIYCFQW